MNERAQRFPDALVLIFAMIVIAQIAALFLPKGQYQREGRQVVPGSYERIVEDESAEPSGALGGARKVGREMTKCLTLIPKGLGDAQDIIFFVFIVGGVIAVVRATGAIDAAIAMALGSLGSRPLYLIAGMLTLFAVGSSTIGMAEEYMPFIPILVGMCIALKMDAIVALGIVYIGAGVGYGAAALNPFTVFIAKDIAGLELATGQWLRWSVMAVMIVVGAAYLARYARRIRQDPSRSLVADIDYSEGFESPEGVQMTGARTTVLLAFAGMIGLFVWGVKARDWYFTELAALFMALALFAAIVCKLSPNRVATTFCKGAAEMTTTALLIGFARTIEVVLKEAQVIDSVVHGIASVLEGAPAVVAAVGMLVVQSVCNFLIPSGSGQAYVTMPIMAPLADVTGVGREAAVFAYQFGDGLTNMIVPTNALLMGMLALGRIPFQRWLRFILPLMVVLYGIAALTLFVVVKLYPGAAS